MRSRLPGREPIDYTTMVRSHDEWPDHRARVLVTGALLAWMRPESLIDPACGEGSIVRTMDNLGWWVESVTLGDLSPGNMEVIRKWSDAYQWLTLDGDAFEIIARSPDVDVVVLTEILEHLDDPDALLKLAATKAKRLIASSPEMRPGQIDPNPEHLWMFDGEGYEQMLIDTGWKIQQKTHLSFRSMYDFQIWVADRG